MVAKGMYVDSRSGWFSERSICYLASGRPVLAQDTGIGRLYPTGTGLVTFRSVEEAAEGVEAVMSDYTRHASGARELAEEYFDSDRVLPRLLDLVAARRAGRNRSAPDIARAAR
jgi:glycosyltransferase involved in cell wall biosynthesis